jgi:hypothetical protein
MAPNKPKKLTSHIMIMLEPAEKARWQVLADQSPFRGNLSAFVRNTINALDVVPTVSVQTAPELETVKE